MNGGAVSLKSCRTVICRARCPGTGKLRAAIETHAVPATSSFATARRGGFRLGRAASASWHHPRGRRRRGAGRDGDHRERRHADHRDDRGQKAYKEGRYSTQWKIRIGTYAEVLSNGNFFLHVRFLVAEDRNSPNGRSLTLCSVVSAYKKSVFPISPSCNEAAVSSYLDIKIAKRNN